MKLILKKLNVKHEGKEKQIKTVIADQLTDTLITHNNCSEFDSVKFASCEFYQTISAVIWMVNLI